MLRISQFGTPSDLVQQAINSLRAEDSDVEADEPSRSNSDEIDSSSASGADFASLLSAYERPRPGMYLRARA
jgi:hypothetical protein